MSLRSLVIANTTEPFHSLFEKYPSRDERWRLVLADLQLGDRASLWAGDGKLVVTSFPVAHLDHLRSALGYTEIENFSPQSRLIRSAPTSLPTRGSLPASSTGLARSRRSS